MTFTSPPVSPNININAEKKISKRNYLYVLPVLLLEFLALALTRAVIPSLLLQTFGDQVYLVMGTFVALVSKPIIKILTS